MRAELKQAGKKREFSVSPPSLETALSVLIWLALILLGTLVSIRKHLLKGRLHS